MTELSAHLTDHVIPFVPVRQFVLSFPHRLRYLLAYDHERCVGVLRIVIRAVLGFYRRRARRHGTSGGRSGSVTFIQRFGSAANLNLHFHVIALDGVFIETDGGELRFLCAATPTDAEIATLLAGVRTRVIRWRGYVNSLAPGPSRSGCSCCLSSDLVWDDTETETLVARLTVEGDLARLRAQRLFDDRTVSAVHADGAGHVLVSHDEAWNRYYGYYAQSPGEQPTHRLSILSDSDLAIAGETDVDSWANLTTARAGRAIYTVSGGILVVNVADPERSFAQAYFPTNG